MASQKTAKNEREGAQRTTTPVTEKSTAGKTASFDERYEELRKTQNLPSLDALRERFDIEGIDAEAAHLTKEVAKKVFENIDLTRKTLESLLQPDASILLMQEAEFLSEADHETLATLARQLMRLDRKMLHAEIANSDAECAEFIRQAASEWPSIQQSLLPVIEKMERGWSGKRKGKQTQHYLG